MLPDISVHRPRGVLPKVSIRSRKVVDYQPSWLLLAVPAVVALRAKKKKSAGKESSSQPSPQPTTTSAPDDAIYPVAPPGATTPRRARIIIVPLARLRRRPTRIDLRDGAVTTPPSPS